MNTRDMLEKALHLIPGASSTMAKSPLRGFPPLTPSFAVSARDATFMDEQGRSWIDCDMALGAVIWGYGRREISDAITRQLQRGHAFSVPGWLEINLAEVLLQRLVSFEAVRFCKDGASAVAAAVRIARSSTGREQIVCGTYHGWLDWCAFHHYGGGQRLGIPDSIGALTTWLPEETFAAFSEVRAAECAAVVVCPEHWKPDELRQLLEACRRAGAVVVFDEVKSGMRYGKRGVFGTLGIEPDLLCLSKGLANGLGLAALVGRYDLMQRAEDVHFSSTHSSECLPLAAALAGERLLATRESWPSWRDQAASMIERLRTPAAIRGLTVVGGPGLFAVCDRRGRSSLGRFRAHFVRTAARRGVFTTGGIALSDVHSNEQIAAIAEAAGEAVETWEESDE